MRRPRRHVIGIAIATTCVLVGAAGGITASQAAKTSKSGNKRQHVRPEMPFGGPPVHSEIVVPNKAGTASVNVTIDDGTVTSVSGNELTIREGTKSTLYRSVTITVPSGATIMRNGKTAELTDLKRDDRVHVVQSDDGTRVMAGDTKHAPGKNRGPGGQGGPGGPGGGHGGPPSGW